MITPTEAVNELIQAIRSFLTITQGFEVTPAQHRASPAAVHGIRDQVVGALAIYDFLLPEDEDGLEEPPESSSNSLVNAPVVAAHRIRALTSSLQESAQEVQALEARLKRAKEVTDELTRERDKALQDKGVFVTKLGKLAEENNKLTRKLQEATDAYEAAVQPPVEFVHVNPVITNEQYGHYRDLLDAAIVVAQNTGVWEPKTRLASDALLKLAEEARWLVESGEHDGPKQ